jgi:hypothetical protein
MTEASISERERDRATASRVVHVEATAKNINTNTMQGLTSSEVAQTPADPEDRGR